jgi:calcium/calmodulin-dependent protein kinase I
MSSTLEIPPLICFKLKKGPTDKSLGIQLRQGATADAIEVAKISSGTPASRTPLKSGYEMLSVNDHRIRDAARCAEMIKHYTSKKSEAEIVASAGPRPQGARFIMAKKFQGKKVDATLSDGSIQGLFLEEKNGRVRVSEVGKEGIFANTRINRGDAILSMDGRVVNTVEDCKYALEKSSRVLVPVMTYNVFRRFRSSVMVISSRGKEEKVTAKAEPEERKPRNVGDIYVFGPTLGSGAFSVVKKVRSKETGEEYAMKVVNRASLDKALESALKDEIAILNELRHEHIMGLVDTFATINKYYLVTELLEGGELFDRVRCRCFTSCCLPTSIMSRTDTYIFNIQIVEKTTYTESEARDVCKILFNAIDYCHVRKVCHRDLKPENLLLKGKQCDIDLKIADFGFARKAPAEDSLKTVCGSPGYVSPEILKRDPYGLKTDMWSLGVIIFILLGGYPPFQNDDQKLQFENIKKGNYIFVDKYWGTISDDAKSMIDSLLTIDPAKRLSAEDALSHPWMKADSKRLRRSSLIRSLEGIKEFNSGRRFQNAVKKVSLAVVRRLHSCVVMRVSNFHCCILWFQGYAY